MGDIQEMTTYNFYEIAGLVALALFSFYIVLRYIVVTIKKRQARKRHFDSLWRTL